MGGNFLKGFTKFAGRVSIFKKPRLFRAGSGAECVAGIV